MTVMVSDDGGLTFPRERALVVDASPSMYSNLADGGGGNVLLFYERAGHANTTRTSARPVNVDDRGKRTPNAADASPRNTRAVSRTGTERSQISAAASVTAPSSAPPKALSGVAEASCSRTLQGNEPPPQRASSTMGRGRPRGRFEASGGELP